MTVIIDGVEYVPKTADQPFVHPRYVSALMELTAIQKFHEEPHKHRAWAWDALNALAPDIAALDADEAFDRIRKMWPNNPRANVH